jgi:hypothetical protein
MLVIIKKENIMTTITIDTSNKGVYLGEIEAVTNNKFGLQLTGTRLPEINYENSKIKSLLGLNSSIQSVFTFEVNYGKKSDEKKIESEIIDLLKLENLATQIKVEEEIIEQKQEKDEDVDKGDFFVLEEIKNQMQTIIDNSDILRETTEEFTERIELDEWDFQADYQQYSIDLKTQFDLLTPKELQLGHKDLLEYSINKSFEIELLKLIGKDNIVLKNEVSRIIVLNKEDKNITIKDADFNYEFSIDIKDIKKMIENIKLNNSYNFQSMFKEADGTKSEYNGYHFNISKESYNSFVISRTRLEEAENHYPDTLGLDNKEMKLIQKAIETIDKKLEINR